MIFNTYSLHNPFLFLALLARNILIIQTVSSATNYYLHIQNRLLRVGLQSREPPNATPITLTQIEFKGDQPPGRAYYLPDEVDLIRRAAGSSDNQELYELLFQIFHEGNAVTGGAATNDLVSAEVMVWRRKDADGRPSAKTQPCYLVDDEVVVNSPLNKSVFTLIPVVSGKNEKVEKIKLNSHEDILYYQTKALIDDVTVDIDSGQILSDFFVIDLNAVNQKTITFSWEGKSPEAIDLRYLRVELQSRESPNATPVTLTQIEFKGDRPPAPVIRQFERSSTIEMKIITRSLSGKTIQREWTVINEQNVVINANAVFA